MTEQTWWAVGIAAVLLSAVIGFFIGRQSGGARRRVSELEGEITRQQEEIAGYKREVEAHFDKTATLFVSMAGSYKNLFEHLSSGYEKLSEGSARDLFKQRFAAVLLEGASEETLQAAAEPSRAAEGADATESPADEPAGEARPESVEAPADTPAQVEPRADAQSEITAGTPERTPEEHVDHEPAPTEDAVRDLSDGAEAIKPQAGGESR